MIGAREYLTGDDSWNVQAAVRTFRRDKNQWVVIWRSPKRSVFAIPPYPPKADLTKLLGRDVTWVLVDVVEPGANNVAHYYTRLRVGPDGEVDIRDEWDMSNAAIDARDGEIVIKGSFLDPKRVIRLRGNDVEIARQSPTGVARHGAAGRTADHVAEFILDDTGEPGWTKWQGSVVGGAVGLQLRPA